MPVRFDSPIGVDSGMQQYSIYNFFTDWTGDEYNFIDFKTTVPAPYSYVMWTIEAVGYCYSRARNIRCAWNFYTYDYDIGNINNNNNYPGLTAWTIYSGQGYMCFKARGENYGKGNYSSIGGYTSFTLNAYPTAGNGYRYPIGIIEAALNNDSGNYYK